MSQISRGIFAAIAVSLTLGAVPLALGRDLYGAQDPQDPQQAALGGTPATAINRAAKADRIAGPARADVPTQTISLRLSGVSDTSVLVRIPVVQAASGGASAAPSWTKSGDGKPKVACEPVVSVLTEIAKRLAPGRCVT
jgi:hypothetical protein